MPVRVQFIDEAVEDLLGYRQHEALLPILKKLLRLEREGEDVGQPLRGDLKGWRKIVIGNRDWRIIFRMDDAKTIATVLVIGDRAEEAVYTEAQRRLGTYTGERGPEVSLAEVLLRLRDDESAKRRKGTRKRHDPS